MTDTTESGTGSEQPDATFAASPSQPTAPATTFRTGPSELNEQRYLRHIRNAVVFIAVFLGVICTLAVVGTIYTMVQASNLNSQISNVNNGFIAPGTSSTCMSQGGTDPSC